MINSPHTHEHATLSPSAAKRWINCPGSMWLTKGLPDEKTHYNREGTLFHDLKSELSHIYLDKWGDETPQLIRSHVLKQLETLQAEGNETVLNMEPSDKLEMARLVAENLEFLHNMEVEFTKDAPPFSKPKRLVEKKVSISEWLWGTLDYGFIAKRFNRYEAIVEDSKYGKGIAVSAQNNYQQMVYAIGLANLAKREHKIDIQHFYLFIYQPRIGDYPWTTAQYSIEELRQFENDVLIPAQKKASACYLSEFDPGDEYYKAGFWCKEGFCKVRKTCPILKQHTDNLLLGSIDLPELAPQGVATPNIQLPNLRELPIEVNVQILKNEDTIKEYLGDNRNYLMSLLQAGIHVPGLKLVSRDGNRTWRKDLDQRVIAEQLKEKGVPEVWKASLMTITEAEKIIGKGKLGDLTEKPKTSPTIAEDTDTREAVECLLDELPVVKP